MMSLLVLSETLSVETVNILVFSRNSNWTMGHSFDGHSMAVYVLYIYMFVLHTCCIYISVALV